MNFVDCRDSPPLIRATVVQGQLSYATRPHREIVVVAVAIGAEATVDEVIMARDIVVAATGALMPTFGPDAELHGEPRLRGGWHPAVLQEIAVPEGTCKARGIKARKGKR